VKFCEQGKIASVQDHKKGSCNTSLFNTRRSRRRGVGVKRRRKKETEKENNRLEWWGEKERGADENPGKRKSARGAYIRLHAYGSDWILQKQEKGFKAKF